MKKILFSIFLVVSAVSALSAQVERYKVTSDDALALAEDTGEYHQDKAVTTAQNFFDKALDKNYGEWLQQLSGDCFVNDTTPKKKIMTWWQDLSSQDQSYRFTHEGPSVNANLKILYYAPSRNTSRQEKRVVMVKEEGDWKVISIE